MSGPPYPEPRDAGETGIGQFQVGIDAVGNIIPFEYWDTIISQYANSDIITKLVGNFDAYIDQTQNLDLFYDNIWNIVTARDYGLDVWGRIVGVNRVINISSNTYFGFAESAALTGGIGIGGFNQANFYNGQPITSNFVLNDQTFRSLILAKAHFNITNGSTAAINQILMSLFPHQGNAFVRDGFVITPQFGFTEAALSGGDNVRGFNQAPFYQGQASGVMTMQYVFSFPLTPVQFGIVQSGVLPKPTGVYATITIIQPQPP